MDIDSLIGPPARAVRDRLHPDWHRILTRSWSVRINAVAAVLAGAEAICSVFAGSPPVGVTTFAIVYGLVAMASCGARVLAQSNLGAHE